MDVLGLVAKLTLDTSEYDSALEGSATLQAEFASGLEDVGASVDLLSAARF